MSPLLLLLWLAPQQPVPAASHKPASASTASIHQAASHHAAAKRVPARRHPLPGMASTRAIQIQQALVEAGLLAHASGHWDDASAAAMKRYQAEHHWQTKYVPDARALIALGLGPQGPGV